MIVPVLFLTSSCGPICCASLRVLSTLPHMGAGGRLLASGGGCDALSRVLSLPRMNMPCFARDSSTLMRFCSHSHKGRGKTLQLVVCTCHRLAIPML